MSRLFDSVSIGQIELENRLVIPPMCQYSAVNGVANDWHLVHIGSLMHSGAGLVIMEATAVAPEGRITHDCLGIWNDEQRDTLAGLVGTLKTRSTTRIGIQLSHAGRKASSYSPRSGHAGPLPPEEGWPTIGPSSIPVSDRWHAPISMTAADMDRVVQDFILAARRAETAGFDVIELHGGHGYLLSSFLSPLANKREDSFGGSFDNRVKFPLRVFNEVRAAVSNHIAVGMRINGTDWVEGGITDIEAAGFSALLEQAGADFIHVTSGGNARADIPLKPGYQIPPAETIHRNVNIPVIGVGLITDPYHAEELIESGIVDLVAVGRGHLHNPHWGWMAAESLDHTLEVPYQYSRARLSTFEPPASWKHLASK